MRIENIIYDLGFHKGEDAEFYLAKGFNVIALEANPLLVKKGMVKFKNNIKNGQLILINKAVTDSKKEKIRFYIHPLKSDWGSCFVDLAESDGVKSQVVEVNTVNLDELFLQFGVPRYMKVDIEGYDLYVAKQLSISNKRPLYVSFEINKKDYAGIFSYLFVAGYKNFQLVNQANHPYRAVPKEGREGNKLISYRFGRYSSGYFGEDLPQDKWLSYDDALARYIKYRELKQLDNKELALGWIDLHAKL